MAEAAKLETPGSADELYMVRAEEAFDLVGRVHFTGDVFRLENDRIVALVQHPCAMRKGTSLVSKLLVCGVQSSGPMPSDWASGHFRRMFLPMLSGGDFSIEFDDLDVVHRDVLDRTKRIAILSDYGVNLLMQRWLFHNSRVVVPTFTISAQTTGPMEEAEVIWESVTTLTAKGVAPEVADESVDTWLSATHTPGGVPRRLMLADAQQRSIVRMAARLEFQQ